MTEALYWSTLRLTNIVDPPNSERIGFVDTDAITLSDLRVFRLAGSTRSGTEQTGRGTGMANVLDTARCVRLGTDGLPGGLSRE